MKLKNILIVILLALIPSVAYSQGKIVYGPYLQAVGETSFTVVWVTDVPTIGWVEIAPDDNTHYYNIERPRFDDATLGVRRVTNLHHVTVDGLSPGTKYRYRVLLQTCSEDNILGKAWGTDVRKNCLSVTTLDPSKTEVKFAVVNDMHEQDSIFCRLFSDYGPDVYDFIAFNGDMTSHLPSTDHVYKHYMKSASKIFAGRTPLFLARGNHENRGALATEFLDWFPTSTGNAYYTFRQGPAYFIVLDCGEDKADSDIEYFGLNVQDKYREREALWLAKIVESEEFKSASVKVVFCHVPPKAQSWHGNAEIHRLFVPLLNKAGVDLMICGHEHKYSYREAGQLGCDFPVLTNANRERLEVSINSQGISAEIYSPDGKLLRSVEVK